MRTNIYIVPACRVDREDGGSIPPADHRKGNNGMNFEKKIKLRDANVEL